VILLDGGERGPGRDERPRAPDAISDSDNGNDHDNDPSGLGAPGLHAFLMVRRPTLAFAPGMAVFPGGSVDPRDFDGVADVEGPPPAEWAERLGVDEPLAAALLCAAVRETFEETGVLLATRADRFVDTQEPAWRETRRLLEAHDLAFSEVLAGHGLALRTDLLTPWARWTTPRFERRRFRTWFFVAHLPAGQSAEAVSTESTSGSWTTPARAMADADSGIVDMLPPQYYSLAELDAEGAPGAGLVDARELPVVEPRVGVDRDGAFLELPPRILRFADRR
jgi:8-oxo-dGTP pyrophosphatase MutT (NUDIX family)